MSGTIPLLPPYGLQGVDRNNIRMSADVVSHTERKEYRFQVFQKQVAERIFRHA
jgi:hypothetical protein